jgi:hypothetical protein
MLKDALHQLHTASHAAAFLKRIGYDPADELSVDGAQVVARWKGFKVVVADSAEPKEAARALARRLAAAGERALVLILGTEHLAVAAPRLGSSGSSRVLLVSKSEPSAWALDQLERLRPRGSTSALVHALRIADVLSAEAAGDRFFTEFRIQLEQMAASLEPRGSLADRRMVALFALTRTLFLYFIQAKGWLDGKNDYLRVLFDNSLADRADFHRSVLNPLFFGTLNRPAAERRFDHALGSIPYLNGGLFEPHPLERRLGLAHFSNESWRKVFEQLFDRYRFCAREADEVNAIAPDMLGRVFERVMAADLRRNTGTFYTPETVVRELVETALATALVGIGGLTEQTVARLMARGTLSENERQQAVTALRSLRVVDPAAGSGAFLLGALEVLTELTLLVDQEPAARPKSALRKRVLCENLFGVDLNPVAVRLAELRLWLAVVADDTTTDPAEVAPLPNLDGVVRQGNSLLDPLGAARRDQLGTSPTISQAAAALQATRKRLFHACGGATQRMHRELRRREFQLARETLTQALRQTDHVLEDLQAAAKGRNLFGRRSGLTRTQQRRYRTVKRNRTDLRRALADLDDGTLPFFSFEIQAADIIAAGGFHVVLGNPPWVRAERLPERERTTLHDRFSWWRSETRSGYAHLPDLAVAFLQRALELTAPGGTVGFLVPSKVASAAYAQAARDHLVRETTMKYVHRIPDRQANRFAATTYPLAIVVRNEPPSARHAVRLGFVDSGSVQQASLARQGPWILVPDRFRDALDAFCESGRPLAEIARPALGVKTGADRIFVGVPLETGPRIWRIKIGGGVVELEPEVLRPALRGRDVAACSARPVRVLLWGYDQVGRPRQRLPMHAASYVNRWHRRLANRTDYHSGPPWVLFRTQPAFARHRVVWPDIARRPKACVLDETSVSEAIPLNSCYVASAPDRRTALAISAVMNSTWAAALAAITADEARGGYRRINARVVSRLPIPVNEQAQRQLATIMDHAHKEPHVGGADIDLAVAEALALPRRVQDCLRRLAANHS